MPNQSTSPAEKLILVVDDEADVLRYQCAILEDAGFEVAPAASLDKALQAVSKRVPDLVSLDLVMPEKGGLKFLYALRKRPEWRTIPVIIVTGHAHDDLGREHLDDIRAGGGLSGPQVCLDKPVRPETYVAAVMERLGMAATAAEAVGLRARVDGLLDQSDAETLRAAIRMLEERSGPPAAASSKSGPRVLVIDDEPDAAAYVAAILEDEGYAAVTLTDPMLALERAQAAPPDLVTLDFNMPRKNGVEVYRELKSDPGLCDVPVIVITALDEEWNARFHADGSLPAVDAFLKKPIEPPALLEAVEKLLAPRR